MNAKIKFPALGVAVEDGTVRVISKMTIRELLGRRAGPVPLAGARAEVTAGAGSHRVGAAVVAGTVFLPFALVGLSKKSKASAFVIAADGTVHELQITGARQIRDAQSEAVRFNALSQAAPLR